MDTLIEVKTIKDNDKTLHLAFKGELDETNADKILGPLIEIINKKEEVIFDFKELTYLNSKTIGYLAEFMSILENNGYENGFKIINTDIGVYDVLELIGLTTIMEITKNED